MRIGTILIWLLCVLPFYHGLCVDAPEKRQESTCTGTLYLVVDSDRSKNWQFEGACWNTESSSLSSFARPSFYSDHQSVDPKCKDVTNPNNKCGLVLLLVPCDEWQTCIALPPMWRTLECCRRLRSHCLRSMGAMARSRNLSNSPASWTMAQITQKERKRQRQGQKPETEAEACREGRYFVQVPF